MRIEDHIQKGLHRFLLNLGPQHPATHGVLRIVLEMDGEYITGMDPVIGYGHRMQEKMGESRPWPSFMPNTARMDYLAALHYNHGYVALIEKMMGIEVPRRAEFIRVATSELNRVASHLVWIGAFLLDLGAFTPILYGFDDREQILDILEDVTGSRLTYSYYRVGGVYRDVDDKFVERSLAFVARMRKSLETYDKLVTGNAIFRKRTEGIGIISPDMARRYGITGANLRASGISYDIRRAEPYSVYPEIDFEIPTRTECDTFARYLVRVEEIRQSLRIIEQSLAMLPEGDFRAKTPKRIKLPPRAMSFSVEAARGELIYYLMGQDTETPYRLKVRVPSFANLSLIAELCEGMLLSDLISAMGSLDLVIPEIDR